MNTFSKTINQSDTRTNETCIKSVFALLLLTILVASKLYSNNLNCRFEQYFIKGQMDKWKALTDSLYQIKTLEKEEEFTLLFSQYGLIGKYMGNNEEEKAKPYIAKFETRLESNLKKHPKNATLRALHASLIGFKIGLSPWRAPFLGKINQERVDLALKYSNGEPLPLIEQANSLFFRPEFIGGDKEKALKIYLRAFDLLSKEDCNWLYWSTGAWIGQVYNKTGDIQNAKKLYIQLLKKQPDFEWAKELYRELEKNN